MNAPNYQAFPGSSGAPTGAAGGDLGGDYPDPDVVAVAGVVPSAFGLSLLDDANAAAGRTTLGLGTAAVEALTTNGATVTGALGAADNRIVSSVGVGSGLGVFSDGLRPGNQTTVTATALRVSYQAFRRIYRSPMASIQMEVTTLSAGNFRIGVYKQSAGLPGAKIWDSGNVSSGTTGVKNVAFSAGTWSDTSYKVGNNLVIPQGEQVWFAFQTDTGVVPAFRAWSLADTTPAYMAATMGFGVVFGVYSAPGSFGLPSSASGFTTMGTAVAAILPLEA